MPRGEVRLLICLFYINFLLQTDGTSIRRRGKISSLPSSISRLNTSFEKKLKELKFPTGPTIPRPGPTLLRQVATEEIDSSNDRLLTDTKRTEIANNAIYRMKYPLVVRTVSSSIVLPSILILLTELGRTRLLSVLDAVLAIISIREIFRPPPVEPAQAPINISIMIMVFANPLHTS